MLSGKVHLVLADGSGSHVLCVGLLFNSVRSRVFVGGEVMVHIFFSSLSYVVVGCWFAHVIRRCMCVRVRMCVCTCVFYFCRLGEDFTSRVSCMTCSYISVWSGCL